MDGELAEPGPPDEGLDLVNISTASDEFKFDQNTSQGKGSRKKSFFFSGRSSQAFTPLPPWFSGKKRLQI